MHAGTLLLEGGGSGLARGAREFSAGDDRSAGPGKAETGSHRGKQAERGTGNGGIFAAGWPGRLARSRRSRTNTPRRLSSKRSVPRSSRSRSRSFRRRPRSWPTSSRNTAAAPVSSQAIDKLQAKTELLESRAQQAARRDQELASGHRHRSARSWTARSATVPGCQPRSRSCSTPTTPMKPPSASTARCWPDTTSRTGRTATSRRCRSPPTSWFSSTSGSSWRPASI